MDNSIIEHPHIEMIEGICGGSPKIKGRRIRVAAIVEWVYVTKETPECISENYELSLSEVYDALSFYWDNKEMIDSEISLYNELYEKGKKGQLV